MILDRHGADYWIENTSGGVAFTMSFPAAPETLVASFKTAQPQEAVQRGHKSKQGPDGPCFYFCLAKGNFPLKI